MVSGLSPVLRLDPVAFAELSGWREHDHAPALDAFRLSCRAILETGTGFSRHVAYGGGREHWRPLCEEALGPVEPRRFFERRFRAFRVNDPENPEGLFTGYFEPEVPGSRSPSAEFQVPLYRHPPGLVAFSEEERIRTGLSFGQLIHGSPVPFFTRKEIEEGALAGQGLEIAWLQDWADAFFMHIQGSGRVRLSNGEVMRLTYDGKSGLPYTSIGGILADQGQIVRERLSMQAIRRWMAGNEAQARQLMWRNESFVFFREVHLERPDLGALGAQHVQLTPRRSMAVDRSIWMFGTPVWLDTAVPAGDEGGMTSFRQLLIAQDTGSAIKGPARGDVYWGSGEAAAFVAGHMKSPGRMTVLLPFPVAAALGLAS